MLLEEVVLRSDGCFDHGMRLCCDPTIAIATRRMAEK